MIRILTVLFLLNGFIACNDRPEPIEVITPKSVSTTIVDQVNDNELVILLNKKQVGYRMDNESDSSVRVLQDPTVADIKAMINTAKGKVEKTGKKFILTIKSKENQEYVIFKRTIDALKELDIYKFSMITDTTQAASK
jgi:hypothetical protein